MWGVFVCLWISNRALGIGYGVWGEIYAESTIGWAQHIANYVTEHTVSKWTIQAHFRSFCHKWVVVFLIVLPEKAFYLL